ncbi:MAG: AraC family transcriptional regulator [Bacteroides sp.]|nr:AraC family transcriptional regulator [Bacteroides sp.]
MMNEPAFRFDDVRVTPDRQIGLNSHPQWELSLVVCGSGWRTVGDRTEPSTAGEVILIPPGVAHVWNFDPAVTDSDGCVANITVFFEQSLLDGLARLMPELTERLSRLTVLDQALAYTGARRRTITGLLYAMRGKRADERAPLMMRLLVELADTQAGHSVGAGRMLTRAARRMERVRTFCACNYGREVRLDEVAAYVGMNKSAFCTFVKRQSGMTFSAYLNEQRLNRAVECLRMTDDSIAHIAYSVGFANVTYFNRVFRARYGCSPRELRSHSKSE